MKHKDSKRALLERSVQQLKRKTHDILMDVLLGERYVGKIRVKAFNGIFAIQDAVEAAKQKLPGVRGSESKLVFFPITDRNVRAAIPF